ncbi:MAG: DUF4935 domain-containing protein [Roseburia sp.]|nr:DUF4935 domain-containing protein [Roseburia sp.]
MIYIVFDTNMLYNSSAKYSDFSFNKNIDLIIDFLKKEELTDKCSILIPKIVIDELKQQREHFYEDYKKIQDLSKRQGELCNIEWNIGIDKYEGYIDQKIEKYLIQKNVKIIDVCSDNSFKRILDKAIKKKPPFEGIEKKSDKGFKDAVIWHSLIEYSVQYGGIYIFYTNDNIFLNNKEYLSKDFEETEYRKVKFFQTIDEIRTYILKELDLNFILDEYFERLQEIKLLKCLDKFLNEIESFPDLFIVDEKTYFLRMVNYDLKNIRMPSMIENESLIHIDAEIGIYEDLSMKFYIIFEITATKIEEKWKVTKYELILKSSEFNKMDIDMS